MADYKSEGPALSPETRIHYTNILRRQNVMLEVIICLTIIALATLIFLPQASNSVMRAKFSEINSFQSPSLRNTLIDYEVTGDWNMKDHPIILAEDFEYEGEMVAGSQYKKLNMKQHQGNFISEFEFRDRPGTYKLELRKVATHPLEPTHFWSCGYSTPQNGTVKESNQTTVDPAWLPAQCR